MRVFYTGLSRLMLIALLFGAGLSVQAQSITLGTPAVGDCTLDGNVPTSTVSLTVSWTAPPSGDLIEVTLNGASVVSTNPVLINPATATSGMTVSFDALSDGTADANITAVFRTPISGATSSLQTTADFDIAANTCTGGMATICTDGTNGLTLTPDETGDNDDYTNVMWYAIDDNGVETLIPVANYGANNEIEVVYNGLLDDGTTLWSSFFYTNGAGDPEAKFYYTATDENGCVGELCIPVTVTAEVCYDLALTKTKAAGEPATYAPGDMATFTFTVTNQGTRTAHDIDVTDYLPTGLTNPTLVAQAGVSQAGSVFTVESLNGSDAGAPTEVSFDVTFTIPSEFMGASITNAAEISAFYKEDDDKANGVPPSADEDSTPDNMDMTNGGETEGGDLVNDEIDEDGKNGGDEDDHDIETISMNQIFDLALTKVETSSGPYGPGSNTVFTITIYNQGTLDATDIDVTDYIPTDMSYTATGSTADGSSLTTADGATVTLTNDGAGNFTIPALAAGDEVSFDIGLTIDADFMGTSITNNAEITDAANALNLTDQDDDLATTGVANAGNETNDDIDDEAVGTPGTIDNADDQDDFDPETIAVTQVFDLALTKVETSSGPYGPGSNTVFTITIYNQGTLDATNIDVTDYIPTDMTYTATGSTADGSSLTTADGATVTLTNDGAGNFTIPALAAGDEVSFDIGLMIDADFMGTSITNNAEIVDADNALNQVDQDSDLTIQGVANAGNETNDDIDDEGAGTPGTIDNGDDQDDFDPETLTVTQVFDLALTKVEASTGPYLPGSDVTFTVNVYNQGTLDGDNIVITDNVPTGLTNPVVNTTGVWSGTAGTVTDNGGGVFTLSALEAGENVAVSVTFTIDENFTGTSLVNTAEITAAENDLDIDDEDSGDFGTTGPGPNEVDDDINDAPDNPDDQDEYDGDEISIRQEVAIGNLIFSDVDGDGIFDAGDGDVGIDGVIVELYLDDGSGVFANATKVNVGPDGIPGTADDAGDYVTNGGGFYYFDQLDPDQYFVYIPSSELADGEPLDNFLSSIPEGIDDAMDDNADENGQNTLVNGGVVSTLIDLALNMEPTAEAGQGTYPGDLDDNNVNETVDFAFTPEYRIGNLVWEDVDNDGIAETGEPGIDGVVVNLYEDNGTTAGVLDAGDTFIETTTTAGGGKYEFTGLYQGDYIVLIPDAGNTGGGENLEDYFSSTTDDTDPNSTTDLTGDDNNDNGVNTVTVAGLEGLASAVITLGTGDSEPIDEQLRADDAANDDTDGTAGTVPDNRSNVTVDFGFYQKLSLGDLVFLDSNNSGTVDGAEVGIEGVEVRLLDGTGAPVNEPGTTDPYVLTTDVNGNYLFEGLDPGDYIVELVTPEGYKSSTGADGATGNYETAPDPDDGVIFGDVNDDDNGTEETATTIRSLPITLTSNGEPADDGDTDTNTNLTLDFGIIGYSVGNYVWADADNSGDVNGAEAGIDGVTVLLLDENDNPVDDPNQAGIQNYEVVTDNGGFYFFGNLPAGEYKVQIVGSNFADGTGALDNLIPSTGAAQEADPDTGGDQNDNGLGANLTVTDLQTNGVVSDVFELGEGDGFQEPQDEATTLSGNLGEDPNDNSDGLSNLTVDFGFTPSMSVGSTVFADANNNGTQDGGEAGIDGVTVQLFNSGDDPTTATPVQSTSTAGGGNYYFEGLPEGDYFIYLPNVATELAATPKSSEITEADPDDNVDGNDNGIQTNTGDPVQSGVFTLEADTEPVDGTAGNANEEGGLGANQDDADDNNGNMTVDFGFYQPMDFGDLADLGAGTGTGDYETALANGGPSHIIVDGLQIGATIDDEIDGQQSANADGDDNDSSGDDEDGVDIAAQTYKPGNTVNIPVTVTNDTDDEATLYAFIDWNNDGLFTGPNETVTVTVPANSGTISVLATFTVPTDATPNDTIGARFRLSTDTGLGANGAATDGEVEDYTITIMCPTGNCFGVTIDVQDKN